MIEKISVINFKSHAHTEIELGRVTALVGPNGCGKTSMLQAIYCIGSLSTKKAPTHIFNNELAPELLVREHGKAFSIEAGSFSEKPYWQLKLFFSAAGSYTGSQREWYVKPQGHWQHSPIGNYDQLSLGTALQALLPAELRHELGPVQYFKASPSKLSAPSPLDAVPPVLSSDGGGLSSVIANLILSDPDRHKAIEMQIGQIVPTVLKVRAAQTNIFEKEVIYSITANGAPISSEKHNNKPGYELIFDTVASKSIPASAMSEGTMLALGMITLLNQPYPPSMLLIDDIEYGLHPLAQREMMGIVKRFAEELKCQIVLTTHSPYVVDELEAKNVWVMATDKEGVSHCEQLSKGPNAEFALKVLTTGEFLGAEGEDWVLEKPIQEELVHA